MIRAGSGARPGARELHFPVALCGRRRAQALLRAGAYKSRLQVAFLPFLSSSPYPAMFVAPWTSARLTALPHPRGPVLGPHSPDAFLEVGGCGACCGGTGLLHLGSGGPRNRHDRLRGRSPACAPRPSTMGTP
nr:uncharacterized protein LOC110557184 [Meriones unguiculatus]